MSAMTAKREAEIRALFHRERGKPPRDAMRACVSDLLDEIERLKLEGADRTVGHMKRLGNFIRGFKAGAGIRTVEDGADAEYTLGWERGRVAFREYVDAFRQELGLPPAMSMTTAERTKEEMARACADCGSNQPRVHFHGCSLART